MGVGMEEELTKIGSKLEEGDELPEIESESEEDQFDKGLGLVFNKYQDLKDEIRKLENDNNILDNAIVKARQSFPHIFFAKISFEESEEEEFGQALESLHNQYGKLQGKLVVLKEQNVILKNAIKEIEVEILKYAAEEEEELGYTTDSNEELSETEYEVYSTVDRSGLTPLFIPIYSQISEQPLCTKLPANILRLVDSPVLSDKEIPSVPDSPSSDGSGDFNRYILGPNSLVKSKAISPSEWDEIFTTVAIPKSSELSSESEESIQVLGTTVESII